MSKKTLRIEPSAPVDVEIRRGSPKIKKVKTANTPANADANKPASNAGDAANTNKPASASTNQVNSAATTASMKPITPGKTTTALAKDKDVSVKIKQTEVGANSDPNIPKDRDTIRIYIRDAKPPIFARILQGSMRVVCLVLLACVCAIGLPRLFGVSEFNVETGSMAPEYPVGTLVFVQPKDPSTIRPGEVVTVIMNENLDMLTHRVTQNYYDEKMIVTKGDANNSEDSPTLYENIVGVVVFSIPVIGEVVNYLTNTDTGRIVGIGILIGIIALTFLAEGICSLLTKQDAKTYDKNNKPIEVPSPFPKKEKPKKKTRFMPAFKLRSNKTKKKKKKKK